MTLTTELAAVDYVGLLTDTCTISRAAEGTQGQYGTTPKAWPDLATSVACRYDEPPMFMAGQEIKVGNELIVITGTIFFLAAQDVKQNDRVTNLVRSGTTILSGPVELRWVFLVSGESHHKEAYIGYAKTS